MNIYHWHYGPNYHLLTMSGSEQDARKVLMGHVSGAGIPDDLKRELLEVLSGAPMFVAGPNYPIVIFP